MVEEMDEHEENKQNNMLEMVPAPVAPLAPIAPIARVSADSLVAVRPPERVEQQERQPLIHEERHQEAVLIVEEQRQEVAVPLMPLIDLDPEDREDSYEEEKVPPPAE